MAKKKPLVLDSANQPQNLQPGDYIGDEQFITLTNGESGTVVIGTPVYISAADTAKKAKGDAAGTSRTFALVADTTIATATSGNYQAGGILALTTGQWDAVTGGSGGLVFGTLYYLSNATAGMLTSTPPLTGYSQVVGMALSTTEMDLTFEQVYKL